MVPEVKERDGHPVPGAENKMMGLQLFRELFAKDATEFVHHSFVHKWGDREFRTLRESLKPGHVIDQCDFTSGYHIRPRQGWQDQVYNCAKHSCLVHVLEFVDDEGDHQLEAHHLFSSDTKQDVACKVVRGGNAARRLRRHGDMAAWRQSGSKDNLVAWVLAADIKLKKERVFKRFRFMHRKSDGCGAHFKSKSAFNVVSTLATRLGLEKVDVSYHVSEHGRSICDPCGGVVHQELDALLNRADDTGKHPVRDVPEIVAHLRQSRAEVRYHFRNHHEQDPRSIKKRFFWELDPADIDRVRKDLADPADLAVLKGTMRVYQVFSTGKEGHVAYRPLPCACKACVAMKYHLCKTAGAGPPKVHDLGV
eukprot:gene17971-biopygen789